MILPSDKQSNDITMGMNEIMDREIERKGDQSKTKKKKYEKSDDKEKTVVCNVYCCPIMKVISFV